MNKKLKTTLIIVALLVVAWFVADSILSKGYVMPEMSERTKIFNHGSIDDIRLFLQKPNSGVEMDNYYALINRDQPNILEMMFKEFKLDPDFDLKYKYATPLLSAAKKLKSEIVSVLIKYGADVNYQDPYGMTPLIAASYTTHEHEKSKSMQITKMLVEAGANVNVVSDFGYTAIGGALSLGDDNMDRVMYLVNKGTDINHLDVDGSNYMFYCSTIQCVRYFVNQGLDINSTDSTGENLIQSSVQGRFKTIGEINQLLELGADICHKDKSGDTILNYIERRATGPHDKKEKPEYYQKRLAENRASEVYLFLEQKYQDECL